MTLREACQKGKQILEAVGIPEAALDAWYLLEYVTGVDQTVYLAEPQMEAGREELDRYMSLIQKRAEHVPLQHLTGEQEFMGLSFRVNENVLIPRQDTEILVETALQLIEREEVPIREGKLCLLDLCTGSGCILVSLIHHLCRQKKNEAKFRIYGVGSDISKGALAVAAENAARHHVNARFVWGDLFENIRGKYGMILSNPPYIPRAEISRLQEEVRLYDPVCALDGKEDGLYFYRRIVKESRQYLEKGGILIFEIGYDQARDVERLMSEAGFSRICIRQDLAGLDRVVFGRYDNE